MISLLNTAVDRLIGAEGLKPPVRARLAAEQALSTLGRAPATAGAAIVFAFALVAVTIQRAEALPVAIWAVLTAVLYLKQVADWQAVNGAPPDAALVRSAPRRVTRLAALSGLAWGSVLLFVPFDDPVIVVTLVVGVGGMFSATLHGLANYPQAALAAGSVFALAASAAALRLHGAGELALQTVLIATWLALAGVLVIRQAATFVELRSTYARVHEKEEAIALLLKEFDETSRDWLWGLDAQGRIDRASDGFSAATGAAPEDLIGADFVEFLSCITAPDDLLMRQLRTDLAERQIFNDVELKVEAGGVECWWRLTGRPTFDEHGDYLGYIGTGSDISELKRTERRMSWLAHNDSLTGLYNRTKFTDSLNQCVARLERYGSPFALLYLDLDNFKLINDSRGHMVGDKLLVQVAQRIQGTMREADFVARLGGDEFSVILTSDCPPENCAAVATRLIEEIRKPFMIDGEELAIGVSVGIAVAPVNGTRPDQLQRNADLALYRAKEDGRSVYRFFESQMDSDARERRLLEIELRDAIKNNELMLFYQPLVSADDKQPTGFEALMRWQHPIRGIVPPSEFIPIAEQSSLILEIGDWTIEEACRAAASWPENLSVAVNLSAKHFRMSDISTVVKRGLARSGLAPGRLELEITEGLLMDNPEEVTDKLNHLREIGVTIVMDDFGTGYSSLSYLLKFPFDKIKIDRSFVSASTTDPMARDILRAIASLGKTLKLKITAEGVETREQAEFLREIACHQLQGFYFARPLDGLDMPLYLLSNAAPRLDALKAETSATIISQQLGAMASDPARRSA